MAGASTSRNLGLRHELALSALAILAAGCGKKPVSTSADPPAVSQEASAGPRIMPAVGADDDQLLPDVPAGYTGCTKSVFDPRIDPRAAAERSDAWQARPRSFDRRSIPSTFVQRSARPTTTTRSTTRGRNASRAHVGAGRDRDALSRTPLEDSRCPPRRAAGVRATARGRLRLRARAARRRGPRAGR
jgi:hypothetical protein